MSLFTTTKDYFARQGINYDKATERLLKGRNDRPTVKVIPVVLAVLVETSVKADSIAPLLKGK